MDENDGQLVNNSRGIRGDEWFRDLLMADIICTWLMIDGGQ
jgi:hypothetical protein